MAATEEAAVAMFLSRDAMYRPRHSPVALLLVIMIVISLTGLPFLNYAANRLVAGQALMLWQTSHAAVLLLPLALLIVLLWCKPARVTLLLSLLAGELLLAGMIWLSGNQAALMASQGSPLALTSFASGMWCASGLTLLLMTDVIRRYTRHSLAGCC